MAGHLEAGLPTRSALRPDITYDIQAGYKEQDAFNDICAIPDPHADHIRGRLRNVWVPHKQEQARSASGDPQRAALQSGFHSALLCDPIHTDHGVYLIAP